MANMRFYEAPEENLFYAGIVILMLDADMEPPVAKEMLQGGPICCRN